MTHEHENRRNEGAMLAACLWIASIAMSSIGAEEPDSFPARWVLLDSEPRLWSEPGGARSNRSIHREAGEQITVVARRSHGEPPTSWLRVVAGEVEGWLPEALAAPWPQEVSGAKLSEIGLEPVDRYHGIAPTHVPGDLVAIKNGYERDRTYRLRSAAARAYERMIDAAAAAGIRLEVVSAYRSYSTQRTIYLRKIKNSTWNQTTVAKPGHSEHQLGTAVDLSNGEEKTLLKESFGETEAGGWLLAHAPRFGFAISYTGANRSATGYSPEPWHYRFYGLEKARARHEAALRGG